MSPPLGQLNGERLAISIPRGWKITLKDTPYYWGTREYNFYIKHVGNKKKAILAHARIGYSTKYRVESFGGFTGKRFRTASGLMGWYDEDEMPDYLHYDKGRSHTWSLSIPHRHLETITILQVDCFPKDKALVKRLVQPLFRNVAFRRKQRR